MSGNGTARCLFPNSLASHEIRFQMGINDSGLNACRIDPEDSSGGFAGVPFAKGTGLLSTEEGPATLAPSHTGENAAW